MLFLLIQTRKKKIALHHEQKQDKKKLPTGRAKKRMQYNRRFVNVVNGGMGKRVGPNNNAARLAREAAAAEA